MAEDFWDEQRKLPWKQRDGLWWTEVVFPNVAMTLVVLAAVVALVWGVLD